jgi:hypothetical protein
MQKLAQERSEPERSFDEKTGSHDRVSYLRVDGVRDLEEFTEF